MISQIVGKKWCSLASEKILCKIIVWEDIILCKIIVWENLITTLTKYIVKVSIKVWQSFCLWTKNYDPQEKKEKNDKYYKNLKKTKKNYISGDRYRLLKQIETANICLNVERDYISRPLPAKVGPPWRKSSIHPWTCRYVQWLVLKPLKP